MCFGKAAFAAGDQCQLTGNPITNQSTVVHDRLLTTQTSHLLPRTAVIDLFKEPRACIKGGMEPAQCRRIRRQGVAFRDLLLWAGVLNLLSRFGTSRS